MRARENAWLRATLEKFYRFFLSIQQHQYFFRLKRHRQQQQPHDFESIVDVVERKLYEKINSKPAIVKIMKIRQISSKTFIF